MHWTELRGRFPVTRQWAFLDHAGVSAASAPAAIALAEYSRDIAENGSARIGHWSNRAREVREAVARFINAVPAGVAFVKNTSEGIEYVANGLPWRAGDNVVLPADEYPSNVYPWMNLAGRGVEVRPVAARGNRVELGDLFAAVDARTRVLAVSSVGYASGFRIDLAALADGCRTRNVLLCVDAIQGLGPLALDVAAIPVDFIACGGHKWLLGYSGIGFLYIRPGLLDRLTPSGVGAHSVVHPFNYDDIHFDLKPDATRMEGGTLNLGGIAALGASIDLLADLGQAIVSERVRCLTNSLCERAGRAGLRVYSSRNDGDWSGIVSLETPGRDPVDVMRRCRSAGVVVNCRGGRLRASPHFYNNEDDVERFLDAARPVSSP